MNSPHSGGCHGVAGRSEWYIPAILENLMSRYCISFASGWTIGSSAAVVYAVKSVAVSIVNWESTDPELDFAELSE